MYKGYKVIIVTPAGRRRYLDIFKKHIYRKMNEGLIDGWQLWQNSTNEEDIAYHESMEKENDKVKIYRLEEPINPIKETIYQDLKNYNALQTHKFSKYAMEDDSIYIRFDDDIVWCEEGAIEKMVKARIDNPDALYIYPNIINSTWVTSMHQEIGALSEEAGVVQKYDKTHPNKAYLDKFNYSDFGLIDLIHKTFRKRYEEKSLSAYYLPSKSLTEFQRFSICSMVWWGKDHLQVGEMEEPQMSWEMPKEMNRPNFFCGDALMVHFSYHTQREWLEANTNHLEFYKNITK